MYQLIIKNGRVLDPANGIDRVASVAVENGRIVAAGQGVLLLYNARITWTGLWLSGIGLPGTVKASSVPGKL